MGAEISDKLKIYIEENVPQSKEMGLEEFLSKETAKEFGIEIEIENYEEGLIVRYKTMGEFSKINEEEIKFRKKERVRVNYSPLSAYVLFYEVQEKYFIKYVPSLKFFPEVFFLLNKTIGFKQRDFIDYYSFVLDPPDPVIRFPKILNKSDLAGEAEYMFVSEAREYFPIYWVKVMNSIYEGNNGKKDQGRQTEEILKTKSMNDSIICALNLLKPSYFLDCRNCESCYE